MPVLHSYTVQFPRVCTNCSIGSTCSVGLQRSRQLTFLLPTHEASMGPASQMSRGENTSGEESTAGEVAKLSPPLGRNRPSVPFTHKPHTGLVQVDGFPQGLGRRPNLSQLTRQVLHQGQQFSLDVVPLERIHEVGLDRSGGKQSTTD